MPAHAIRRERLERLLDAHADRRVVLVRGPAGAGKSILVAQWLRARDEPCAWLTVGSSSSSSSSSDDDALREVVDAAIGAPRVNGSRTNLVVDGVDRLQGQGARSVLARLVEQPPAPLRLVLVARSKPQLGLERARLRGDMFEVGGLALRFRRVEIDALAATWADRSIDTAEIEQATLGWAAGLRLVQLQASADRTVSSALQEPDSIAREYAREELIDGSSPELRSFLEVACWLPTLTWPLCAAVASGAQGGSGRPVLLSEIEALPLLPVADRPGAFCFPPILARVLRQEQRRRDPQAAAGALFRAAEACRRVGEPALAIELLLLAGRSDDAARACAELAARDDSALQQVDELLRGQPEPTHAGARWLPWRVRAAVAAGRVDDARSLLHHAVDAPAATEPLLIARATVAERLGDVGEMLTCADALLATAATATGGAVANLPPNGGACSPVRGQVRNVTELRAHGWRVRALVWSGDADGARRALGALEAAAASDPGATGDVALARAWVAWWDGDVAVAAQALAGIGRQLAEWELLAGAVDREQDRFAEAAVHLREAVVLAREHPHDVVSALAASELARCHRSAGASMEALEMVVSARLTSPDLPAGVDAHLRGTEARVRLDQRDDDGAHALVRGAPPGVDAQLLAARVALRQGGARVGQLLGAVDARTPRQAVEVLLLRAQVPDAGQAEVSAALKGAVAGGEPLGLVRTFLDEGDELLRRLPDLALESTDRSLGRIAALACQELAQAPAAASRRPVEQLTTRELAVLRMLPLRMSNREMAAQMYISINTLKTHVGAIYRKLEVPHRSAAVRRARALQLV